jgi:hypothetical protein
VFVVKNNNGKYSTVNSNDNKLMQTNLGGIKFYKNAFPTSRGLDHPNEISAYMFSDYFKILITGINPGSETKKKYAKNLDLFIQWIEKEMK